MSDISGAQPEQQSIVACTVSRDVQNFDLLIEDMEISLGEAWGDLSFDQCLSFFRQEESNGMTFIALAIDAQDEGDLDTISEVIRAAKSKKLKVVLIAEAVSPACLHQLLRSGADEFIPYPLPEGELQKAIDRMQAQAAAPTYNSGDPEFHAPALSNHGRDGVVVAVQGISGGTGATTLATNLACELAGCASIEKSKVCLIDFDLQFGSVATYLDLSQRDAVLELYAHTETMDSESFTQAMQSHADVLNVLTAPSDLVPLDLLANEDVERILAKARQNFDYVVVDMPTTITHWTETVLTEADLFLTTLELDMRSAQNTVRLRKALKSEGLPAEKLRYVLNKGPKFTDLTGRSRVKRMCESLEISIDIQLPDGGRAVSQAGDQGEPLGIALPKSPLRKEIMKLAKQIRDRNETTAVAA